MKKLLGFSALALLLGLTGFRLYQGLTADAAAAGPPRGAGGRAVGAAVAELGPISQSVTLVGSLRAEETVDVTPRINGRVTGMHVDLGDRVQAGTLLARLEDDELRQQEQQSEASLEVTRAVVRQRELELQNLQAVLDRTQGLADQGLVSAEDLEQTQTRYDVGQSQVNVARAQLLQSESGLREVRIRIGQTRIVSPIAGLVGRRYVDAGARVNSNTPVVTIIKLDTVELIANVAERDIVKLQVGAIGRVYVDALPGVEFPGEVARISPLLDAQTRTAQAEIVIPNHEGVLKAEMFARVELELASKASALRVPRDALVVRGEDEGVYVLEDDIAVFRVVRVGLTQGDWIEITEGLAPGELVATLGSNLLNDGDPVRVAGAIRQEAS